MDFGTIGVILGGPSNEREVSLATGKAIAGALRSRGHNVIEIGENGSIEKDIIAKKIDIAFIALHGRYGEDGMIQRFLEDVGVPYTGSGPKASSCAFDKSVSKSIFIENDVPTAEYILIGSKDKNILEEIERKFSFPIVIKPADSGSSIGLSIVKEPEDIEKALDKASECNSKIIIEQYIHGKEITVGILDEAALPVIHIVPKAGHYSYEAKYIKGMTEYIVPAELPQELYKKVQYIGLKAHNVLGCRDFSRVDMRLDPAGNPWVLEVNTIPGFTETSLLPKAAKAVGIEFGKLCERILTLALERTMTEV